MRQAILAAKQNRRTLVQGKQTQRMHKIVSETRIGHLGIVRGLQLLFIDSDKFLTPSRIFSKAIVGNAIKPSRETGFTAKAADVFVGPQESVLCEVIGERDVRSGELAKQASHT